MFFSNCNDEIYVTNKQVVKVTKILFAPLGNDWEWGWSWGRRHEKLLRKCDILPLVFFLMKSYKCILAIVAKFNLLQQVILHSSRLSDLDTNNQINLRELCF